MTPMSQFGDKFIAGKTPCDLEVADTAPSAAVPISSITCEPSGFDGSPVSNVTRQPVIEPQPVRRVDFAREVFVWRLVNQYVPARGKDAPNLFQVTVARLWNVFKYGVDQHERKLAVTEGKAGSVSAVEDRNLFYKSTLSDKLSRLFYALRFRLHTNDLSCSKPDHGECGSSVGRTEVEHAAVGEEVFPGPECGEDRLVASTLGRRVYKGYGLKHCFHGLILLIGVIGNHALTLSVNAEEAACTTLGANCIASEPLNATGHAYTKPGINPNDSTTKQANMEGIAGAAATRNSNDISWASSASDPTIFAALPSGHSITRVMKGNPGHVGIFWLGARLGASFTKQAALRMYIYYSPDFVFAGTGGAACENHKFFEVWSNSGNYNLVSSFGATNASGGGGGAHNFYNTINLPWNHAVDCCNSGPNTTSNFGPTPATARRGKWFRAEVVTTNRAGGSSPNGFQAQVYLKNITDGTAEQKILDTTGTFFSGIEAWGAWDDLTPGEVIHNLTFAAYRQGTCAGFYAFSHMMVAGWNTTGNRIGAASEVESGTGSVPPTAPSNLKVQQSNLWKWLMPPARLVPTQVRWF